MDRFGSMDLSNSKLEASIAENLWAERTTGSVAGRVRHGAIRKWFVAAEAAGEYIGMRYGHVRPGDNRPRWLYYSHAEFDGIGAFAEILRSRGAELEPLPQIKDCPAYSPILSALKHWPRYLARRHPLKWVPLERDQNGANGPGPPLAVAWHIFDEQTTHRILQDSRRMGIKVNALLLHSLTGAIRPFLEDRLAALPWMIPVNMRGGVRQYRDTDNHTSYVAIHVRPDESAAEIHHKTQKALSNGEHWGNWYAATLGHCIPSSVRARMVARGTAISQWTVGVFSNLGEWDPAKKITSPDAAGSWLGCPPVLRAQMLGACCITFQGRLSLTLQAHPGLTTDVSTVRTWVSKWVAGIG